MDFVLDDDYIESLIASENSKTVKSGCSFICSHEITLKSGYIVTAVNHALSTGSPQGFHLSNDDANEISEKAREQALRIIFDHELYMLFSTKKASLSNDDFIRKMTQ